MKTYGLLGVAAALAFASTSSAAVLWDDQAPGAGVTSGGNGLILNAAVDPTNAGNAVGEVVFPGTAKFMNLNGNGGGPFAITPADHGKAYTVSFDYFVPTGTTMDRLPDGSSPDLFWLEIAFNGTQDGSVGFINNNAAGSGWNTLVINGIVPAGNILNPTTNANPLMVVADGGFGAGTPNGTGSGTALFVDNFYFEIVPEPASLALLGMGGLAMLRRR